MCRHGTLHNLQSQAVLSNLCCGVSKTSSEVNPLSVILAAFLLAGVRSPLPIYGLRWFQFGSPSPRSKRNSPRSQNDCRTDEKALRNFWLYCHKALLENENKMGCGSI
jgi:hypothetical protein